MTGWQSLVRVELPNALPIIVGGVRTRAINGTAPLAYLIGADSLGSLIFPGIYLDNQPLLLLGASPRSSRSCWTASSRPAAAIGSPATEVPHDAPPHHSIARAPAPSPRCAWRRAHRPARRSSCWARRTSPSNTCWRNSPRNTCARGYDVEVRSGLGSTLVRSALENGQFDLMWDYTGTAALVYNKINDKLSPDEMYRRVKALDVPRAVWLDASPLNDTYAIGLPSPLAQATGIRTVSQLAEHLKTDPAAKHYVFGMDAEFANRPDG